MEKDVEMKRSVKLCILLSIVLFVISAYSHLYEASSMGSLPVINYPFRPYTVPILILGLFSLFLAIALHVFSVKGK